MPVAHHRGRMFQHKCGRLPAATELSAQPRQPSSKSFSLGFGFCALGGRSLLGVLVPSGDFTPLTPVLPAHAALPGLGMRVPEPGGVLQQHRLTITAVLHFGLLHASGRSLLGSLVPSGDFTSLTPVLPADAAGLRLTKCQITSQAILTGERSAIAPSSMSLRSFEYNHISPFLATAAGNR